MITHKMLNRECPERMKNLFKLRSEISNYQARNSDALQVIRSRLELTKSFCYSAEKIWNNLSKNIIGINPMPKCKKCFKAHIRTQTPKMNPWRSTLDVIYNSFVCYRCYIFYRSFFILHIRCKSVVFKY